jgi:hypothetical protein
MEEKCQTSPAASFEQQKGANSNPAPGLVKARGLAISLCPDPDSRPSLRTIRRWQDMRLIPFLKIGGAVYFDPVQVRRALDARFTVRAR